MGILGARPLSCLPDPFSKRAEYRLGVILPELPQNLGIQCDFRGVAPDAPLAV